MKFILRTAVDGTHGHGSSSWARHMPLSESWTLNRRWSRMLLSKHRSKWRTRPGRSSWSGHRSSRYALTGRGWTGRMPW